jgi:hypothetical protein
MGWRGTFSHSLGQLVQRKLLEEIPRESCCQQVIVGVAWQHCNLNLPPNSERLAREFAIGKKNLSERRPLIETDIAMRTIGHHLRLVSFGFLAC